MTRERYKGMLMPTKFAYSTAFPDFLLFIAPRRVQLFQPEYANS